MLLRDSVGPKRSCFEWHFFVCKNYCKTTTTKKLLKFHLVKLIYHGVFSKLKLNFVLLNFLQFLYFIVLDSVFLEINFQDCFWKSGIPVSKSDYFVNNSCSQDFLKQFFGLTRFLRLCNSMTFIVVSFGSWIKYWSKLSYCCGYFWTI